MNLSFRDGNMFKTQCKVLVCPVNTVGVMGNGLALAFKLKYPWIEPTYRQCCRIKSLTVETPQLFPIDKNRMVLFFATKKHWKNPSELDWISSGLQYISENYVDMGITSIAFPPIGCGKGQLEWAEVCKLMKHHLRYMKIPVEIYGKDV